MAARRRPSDPPRVIQIPALREEELETAQQERRTRMLDATLVLARSGGYDAVQMRTVADEAGVALGTLYRYFPSKIHLLVSSLVRQFELELEALTRREVKGQTPSERVLFVLDRLTQRLQGEPELTEAMTRAFMFADATVTAEVDSVGSLLDTMLSQALGPPRPGSPWRDTNDISRVIGDVWMANLMAWLTHRTSAGDVADRLELTVRLLLDRSTATV
jgi:TetR/AcrR family transcriptional regulator, cholesterol catabolism regulator